MKGFIELTTHENGKILFNINYIKCVFKESSFAILNTDPFDSIEIEESYEEVKKKIEEATEQKIWEPGTYPQTPYPVSPGVAPLNPFIYQNPITLSKQEIPL